VTWYERAFGPDYLALYPHRDDAEAERDVTSLLALIDPPRDEPLLDLGCGPGRHLLALRRHGFTDLTGIDLSQDLLNVAAERFRMIEPHPIRLLRADMREIPFDSHFATTISMFTSFGYFESVSEDARMLRAVHDALRPHGVFLLDTLNRHWTIQHLVPRESRTVGSLHLEITRSITPDGDRVEKTTRVVERDRAERTYGESVRMYEPEQLRTLLVDAGFRRVDLHGSLDGSPLHPKSRRTIAVARRGSR